MNATVSMPAGRLWAAYFGEIRFEFIKALRTPQFAVPTLFFPMQRIERIALDEPSGSIPSLANLFEHKVGLSLQDYLAQFV